MYQCSHLDHVQGDHWTVVRRIMQPNSCSLLLFESGLWQKQGRMDLSFSFLWTRAQWSFSFSTGFGHHHLLRETSGSHCVSAAVVDVHNQAEPQQ